MREAIEEAYSRAIDKAASEVAEGIYDAETLEKMVTKEEIIDRAMALISSED